MVVASLNLLQLTYIIIGALVVLVIVIIAIILGVMAGNGAFSGGERRRMLRMHSS